jgi:mannose-1-phosphate guanylyltransferase / mannose-6-phosphate isomerase
MKKNVAVILSGGSGSRLWPLSRLDEPKQFQAFTDGLSLLAHTVKRADALTSINEILVVCSAAHKALVHAHCAPHSSKPITYLLEPVARNTAVAIASAAVYLEQNNQDAEVCMLVLPSDHHLAQAELFETAVHSAISGAHAGHLVTFGVIASKPETGYGYIEMGKALPISDVYRVERFVEKPNAERAQEMIATGQYRWNSGMFVMGTSLFLKEVGYFAQAVLIAAQDSVKQATQQGFFVHLAEAPLATCPNISVDHAVFEHSHQVAVVSLNVQWTDLGSWSAVADMHDSNTIAPKAGVEVISISAEQNYIRSSKTVVLLGVSNLVVVDTPDALLISHRDHTQSVKEVVSALNVSQPHLTSGHAKVRRPWGTYEPIGTGAQHQVKHIIVQPGGRLSLQSHEHRAEHWVVVSGLATITVGEKTAQYTVGQHVYIQKGEKHRLENHTSDAVSIVEVQIGNYLGEDDIQRYEDVYGRLPADTKPAATKITA